LQPNNVSHATQSIDHTALRKIWANVEAIDSMP